MNALIWHKEQNKSPLINLAMSKNRCPFPIKIVKLSESEKSKSYEYIKNRCGQAYIFIKLILFFKIMDHSDLFKPYSPEIRGDLEAYLREYDGSCADNLFYGPEYFFVIKNKGWMVPHQTWIRVDQSPAPDIAYAVNSNFMLESNGRGRENMSCVGAVKGIHNPSKVLRKNAWSISGLRLDPPAQT